MTPIVRKAEKSLNEGDFLVRAWYSFMMVTLYNAISQDGYISRKDGGEDFIPDELWLEFLDLCKQYDVLMIGRKTYETIQNYPEETIKELEGLDTKIVVATRNAMFTAKQKYIVVHSPQEALVMGSNILVTSGPDFNTSLLEQGLVDMVILNVIPEIIGQGIEQFRTRPSLTLLSEDKLNGGRKRLVYKVIK
jgi:dihydrofolate reductase